MCVPALAGGSLAAGALGSGLGAFGQIMSGGSQAAAAMFNAKTAVQQGQSTVDASRINAQQIYRQGDQLEGQARAAMGANGINPGSGSALQTQVDIGKRTGQDVANEDYNARLAQWGALNNSTLDTAQAGFDKQAGDIGATGTLLAGASQVSSKWAGFQQQGLLS